MSIFLGQNFGLYTRHENLVHFIVYMDIIMIEVHEELKYGEAFWVKLDVCDE